MDINRLRLRAEGGFTLIELLVVIAIIGILAAIAIPQVAVYRKRAFAADVKSNLQNAAIAEEAYYVDFNHYLSGALTGAGTPTGFTKSANVTVVATTPVGGDATKFTLKGTHTQCTGDQWDYSNTSGSITYMGGTAKCGG